MKMPVKLAAIAVGAVAVGGGVFLAEGFARPAEAAEMTVYKSDSCGCCGGWVDHIRRSFRRAGSRSRRRRPRNPWPTPWRRPAIPFRRTEDEDAC